MRVISIIKSALIPYPPIIPLYDWRIFSSGIIDWFIYQHSPVEFPNLVVVADSGSRDFGRYTIHCGIIGRLYLGIWIFIFSILKEIWNTGFCILFDNWINSLWTLWQPLRLCTIVIYTLGFPIFIRGLDYIFTLDAQGVWHFQMGNFAPSVLLFRIVV